LVRLSVRGVSKSFQTKEAVRDVSFEVEDGEFCALLGPSGCGKTTLLRLLAGIETPDAGDILFDGRSVRSLPARERDVGMAFQGYALFPLMTVFENIAFPLRVRAESDEKVRSRVSEVAELLRIEKHLDERPGELSGGEQQRVSLARAIVRQPKLFLMDEPLSSLDAPLRAEMRLELKRLHRKIGVTTVYVTHDQAEALALADRLGVMDGGKLLQFDAPQVVYSAPANLFVARFVGNFPSKTLDVTLDSKGGGFLMGDAKFPLPNEILTKVRSASGHGSVVVSFRPEEVIVYRNQSAASVGAKVSLVESLGESSLLEITNGQFSLKAVAPAEVGYKEGDDVWVSVPATKLHFFDKASGLLVS
jgi:ABC-type sugar transport system ATPase subunit